MRHNNHVIIDVKTFWRPFLLFSRQKRTVLKNCSYFKVTRTRTEPVLLWTAATGIHANSCLLKHIHGYLDSYQCEHGLMVGRWCVGLIRPSPTLAGESRWVERDRLKTCLTAATTTTLMWRHHRRNRHSTFPPSLPPTCWPWGGLHEVLL